MFRTRTDDDIPLQTSTDAPSRTDTLADAPIHAPIDLTARRTSVTRTALTTGILVGALSLGLFSPAPAYADADGIDVGTAPAAPDVTGTSGTTGAAVRDAIGDSGAQPAVAGPAPGGFAQPGERAARVRVVPTLTTVTDVTPFLAPAGILALLFAAGAIIVARLPVSAPTSSVGSVGMRLGTSGGA